MMIRKELGRWGEEHLGEENSVGDGARQVQVEETT